MVGHEQSANDFAFQHVPLQDLCDIVFRTDPVPHSFRIDDHTGTQIAMVQTAGFVGANDTLQVEPLGFALEVCVKLF